jgi:hypothetical protein
MYGNLQKMDRPAMLGDAVGVPPPLPEIAREHEMLRESVEALGGLVSALHEKLRPIVLQRPQAVGNVASIKEQDCYSELGQGISTATAGIRAHAERLHDLLHSLAV